VLVVFFFLKKSTKKSEHQTDRVFCNVNIDKKEKNTYISNDRDSKQKERERLKVDSDEFA